MDAQGYFSCGGALEILGLQCFAPRCEVVVVAKEDESAGRDRLVDKVVGKGSGVCCGRTSFSRPVAASRRAGNVPLLATVCLLTGQEWGNLGNTKTEN